jgi:hypothetical protein
MATPFRNNTRPEECGTSCFRGRVKNLLISTAYKAGLINIFVKDLCKESKGSGYLRQKFPKISAVKKREGIFVGPQIKQLFGDQDFATKVYSTERRAWKSF